MYRSKAILISLRNAYSKIAIPSYLSRAQVEFSSVTSSPFVSNPSPSRNPWQFRYLSSKPSSMLQIVLENDWSKEVEETLRESDTPLTHETAIYVLRKLDKYSEKAKAYCFLDWVFRESGLRPSSPLYSTMLRILAQQRSMKRFWMTLRDMRQGGFYIDEETYMTIYSFLDKENSKADAAALAHFYERMLKENAMSSVAGNVSAVVSKADSSWEEVERELQEMKLAFSDNFVIRVLKEVRDHPLKALAFFRWVGGSYGHSTVTYNAVLRVLAKPDSVKEFWSVVDEMKAVGHEVDLDTYIKVSRQFQKSRMMIEAVKLYEFMMDGQYKPSVQDCCLLLRSLSAGPNPDLDLVFRVSRKYEATGESLSKGVYDGIHRCLTSVGRFDEAEDIVKAMRSAGYEPDNITYSQLVFGLCKAKRSEEARGVLNQMEAEGCFPDLKTWTILIQGHCKNNELDKAIGCFANMLEKGFDIDSDLLDILVDGFLSVNRIEGAGKFVMEMVRNSNVKAWQNTYKGVIDKLLEIKKCDEALDLLEMMKKQNYPAYAEPFDGYLAKFGTVEDAKRFLDVLSSKDSFAAYLHVIQAFYREGRLSDAKNLVFLGPHHFKTHPKIAQLLGAS